MDGLGDQHAAAVTRQRAPARFVVITLRTPPAHAARSAGQFAQLAAGDQGREGHRRFTQPVLQHHGQLHLVLLAHGHQFFGLGQGNFNRLFKQHMLAGTGGALHQVQVGVGRRENQHGLQQGVFQKVFVAGCDLGARRQR